MKKTQQTIPAPLATVGALYATSLATKELVEGLTGQRGTLADIAVTWQDLLDLGLIKKDQVPHGLG